MVLSSRKAKLVIQERQGDEYCVVCIEEEDKFLPEVSVQVPMAYLVSIDVRGTSPQVRTGLHYETTARSQMSEGVSFRGLAGDQLGPKNRRVGSESPRCGAEKGSRKEASARAVVFVRPDVGVALWFCGFPARWRGFCAARN